jgi:hypothetical protein
MSIDFNKWCEKYATGRMVEEYGEDWEDSCPDDDAYDGYLIEAGYNFPFDFDDEDD